MSDPAQKQLEAIGLELRRLNDAILGEGGLLVRVAVLERGAATQAKFIWALVTALGGLGAELITRMIGG